MSDGVPSPKSLPRARLEVRLGQGGPTIYSINETSFLLGTVPGCDLRLPGMNLPSVIALIERHPDAVRIRKLSPLSELRVNDRSVDHAELQSGDTITLQDIEISMSITQPVSIPILKAPVHPAPDDDLPPGGNLQEIEARERELEQKAAEIEQLRKELEETQKQFYQRARKKRDELKEMQLAIQQASQSSSSASSEMIELTSHFAEKARKLEEEQRAFYQEQQSIRHETQQKLEQVTQQEEALVKDRQQLVRSQTTHREELARLDRMASTLESKQKQLQQDALTVDRRFQELQKTTRELEEQAAELDTWHTEISEQTDALQHQRTELEEEKRKVNEKTAALEGQQTMLTSLSRRLERMREEHRREEQRLMEQSEKQDANEIEIQERLTQARRLQQELESEKDSREQEIAQLEERKQTLEQAVTQLRQAQSELGQKEETVRGTEERVNALMAECEEKSALLQSRLGGIEQEKAQVQADRESLQERERALSESQQAMMALQEQLRRRSEEIETFEQEREQFHTNHQQQIQELATSQQQILAKQTELEQLQQQLQQREDALTAQTTQLEQQKSELEQQAGLLVTQREQVQAEQEAIVSRNGELELRRQTLEAETKRLAEQLPDLEDRSAGALEQVNQSRGLLREQLAEIHRYVRESRSDLEALRNEAQEEKEKLWKMEQDLRESQDEHRLAVASFRQQLIEWQGRIQSAKKSMMRGESRLERRQAQVESTSEQLAQQAEKLEQQEKEVAEKHSEVDRHLVEMQQWYRQKLRELAKGREGDDAEDSGNVPLHVSRQREVLETTTEIEPADQKLGDLLRSLELVDQETLDALLMEARRQRRSLRQLLLAGGYLTLFQMALIEAGDIDGLVLGSVRVIDRLYSNSRESVYRVHDPNRGKEVLLRYLSEKEMEDAVRPDEFRQRFASLTQIEHPHVQSTYDVMEIEERPAVLQEWVQGVPGTEWSSLAAVPGVWFRLISQAALGMQAIHQSGLVHGNLTSSRVQLNEQGSLKICGVGEPEWLASEPVTPVTDIEGDLRSLGEVALQWTKLGSSERGASSKPLPDSLQRILSRLLGEGDEEAFANATELLEDLDEAGADVPANAAAWGRFIKQIQEQGEHVPLRRAA